MSQTQVQTSTSVGSIPLYTQVAETSAELDWADLATLDLSKFDAPGGKETLAKQLHNAIEQIGKTNLMSLALGQSVDKARFLLHRELRSHSGGSRPSICYWQRVLQLGY